MATDGISDLIRSRDDCVVACSPGDPARTDGILSPSPIAVGHADWAGEDSASGQLPVRSALELAVILARLGHGGMYGLLTSAARAAE